MSGRFISIEGIEGVGKSTQIGALSRALQERRIDHSVTREPGGTPLAERIRDIVLTRGAENLPPSGELLLMFAARAVHLCNRIEPDLAAGKWVLCDRFTDATYAYQGGGRGMSAAAIADLERLVQGARRPDLTLLLDVPVDEALARARARNGAALADRFESEKLDFFSKVRDVYLARAQSEPQRFAVIDARAAKEQVLARMLAVLRERMWIT